MHGPINAKKITWSYFFPAVVDGITPVQGCIRMPLAGAIWRCCLTEILIWFAWKQATKPTDILKNKPKQCEDGSLTL